jgi:hypothetical protein
MFSCFVAPFQEVTRGVGLQPRRQQQRPSIHHRRFPIRHVALHVAIAFALRYILRIHPNHIHSCSSPLSDPPLDSGCVWTSHRFRSGYRKRAKGELSVMDFGLARRTLAGRFRAQHDSATTFQSCASYLYSKLGLMMVSSSSQSVSISYGTMAN